MKFTQRRNGRRMTTLRLRFDLGGREILRALCANEGRGFALSLGDSATRAVTDKFLRDCITEGGTDAYDAAFDWADQLTGEEATITVSWALDLLLQHYPETVDADLVDYVKRFDVTLTLHRFGPPTYTVDPDES